jgi:hypothetical protein
MPIRFSTEAANADHMRMESHPGVPEGMPDNIGADGTPRDRADRGGPDVRSKRGAQGEPKGSAAREEPAKDTTAKPGKDKDAGKPKP